MKKLIAMVVLSIAFISHNGFAESLLFTQDDGPTCDVSSLNDSNVDESVLLISLHSEKFKNDFWNFEGDDFSLNFLVLPELLWVNDLVRSLLTEDADERHRTLRADSWSQSPLVC